MGYDPDVMLTGRGAKTVMQGFYDNDNDMQEFGSTLHFDQFTPSAQDTWESATSKYWMTPDYLLSGDIVRCYVVHQGQFTAGNEHLARLVFNGNNGDTITLVTASAETIAELTYTATGDFISQLVTVSVEGWDDAGATTNLVIENRQIAWNLHVERQAE